MKYKFTTNSITELLLSSATGFNSWKYFFYSLSYFKLFLPSLEYLDFRRFIFYQRLYCESVNSKIPSWALASALQLDLIWLSWAQSYVIQKNYSNNSSLEVVHWEVDFFPLFTLRTSCVLISTVFSQLPTLPFRFWAKVIFTLSATDRL